jgi:hypothetical protein
MLQKKLAGKQATGYSFIWYKNTIFKSGSYQEKYQLNLSFSVHLK